MRLDKFLKVSRIIKRRSIAKEIADQGRILINGQSAKSSSRVVVGDALTIKNKNFFQLFSRIFHIMIVGFVFLIDHMLHLYLNLILFL